MKLLVVGAGGREHALAWKLAQSPNVQVVYVAPGNAGTGADPRLKNIPITDPQVLLAFAKRERIELTVVGPDAALADGLVDLFQEQGLRIFGPTRRAAELEWSKDFAKGFMQRHGIPTAAYRTFTDPAPAHAYVDAHGAPIVVKADGLAAGKGVVVATDVAQAHAAIDAMLVGQRFGASGARIVIEDFLEGEEASFFVISDGRQILPLQSAQDHKRLLDGDVGPNTGGMGAYSPAPIVTPDVRARVMNQIVKPTIAGMAEEGRPFVGFLFVGLMIDAAGQPRVVEFNARMGDPEAQAIVVRIKNDLLPALYAALDGTVGQVEIDWDRRYALCVTLASHGYPDTPRTGDAIEGIAPPSGESLVFHAGTALRDGTLVTHGGRVLSVLGLGDTLRYARMRAYETAEAIRFDGMQYRRDIGHRALKRG